MRRGPVLLGGLEILFHNGLVRETKSAQSQAGPVWGDSEMLKKGRSTTYVVLVVHWEGRETVIAGSILE